MNVRIAAVIILASALAAFAQSIPNALPPVDISDAPDKILFVGAGIHAGQTQVFVNALIKATGPVYAAIAEDVAGGKTTTRVGFEVVAFRWKAIAITGKGNAGLANGKTTLAGDSATGGAYGVGGSIIGDIDKLTHKSTGLFAAFSGTWDYSNIADVIRNATAPGGIQRIYSDSTLRWALGKKF